MYAASRFHQQRHFDPSYVPGACKPPAPRAPNKFTQSERQVLEQYLLIHGAKVPRPAERAELAEQLGVGTEVIYNWCVSIQLINGGMLTMGTQVQKSHTEDEEESTVWAHAPVSSTRHQSALDYGREVDVIYRRDVGQLLYLRLLIHIS